MNAGMSYGDAPRVIAGLVPGGNLGLSLDFYRIGLDPEAGAGGLFEFAYGGTYASPHEFAAGSDVAAWAGAWSGASEDTCFRWAGYLGSIRSPAFGPGSFIGFRFSADGVNFHYGWIDVRWTLDVHFLLGSFQILGAAYESDANTAILAGATGVAVPLPGAAGLAACGLIGLGRRRRR